MKIGLETGCGHIASALSCVDILCYLYSLKEDKIIILSKGHGVLAQYVILNELEILPTKVLKTYYKDGGLSGHSTLMPEYGIYASTGSLGHGLAIAVGYAIGNPDKLIFPLLSDGELDEGSNWEAFRIINKLKIDNIFPFVDVNGWQGFGVSEPLSNMKFQAYYSTKGEGWGEYENIVDSHYQKVTKDLYKTWKRNKKQ